MMGTPRDELSFVFNLVLFVHILLDLEFCFVNVMERIL